MHVAKLIALSLSLSLLHNKRHPQFPADVATRKKVDVAYLFPVPQNSFEPLDTTFNWCYHMTEHLVIYIYIYLIASPRHCGELRKLVPMSTWRLSFYVNFQVLFFFPIYCG
jgi:hypothetical protein